MAFASDVMEHLSKNLERRHLFRRGPEVSALHLCICEVARGKVMLALWCNKFSQPTGMLAQPNVPARLCLGVSGHCENSYPSLILNLQNVCAGRIVGLFSFFAWCGACQKKNFTAHQ